MEEYINSAYPDIPYLRKQAQKKIPRFAFEYLDGGCNAEVNNIRRYTSAGINEEYVELFFQSIEFVQQIQFLPLTELR
jgi:hypothetical protein